MRKRKGYARRPRTALDEQGAGATFEVLIERILPGGLGLAHAEGRTLLVSLAAPGDRLHVRVTETRGKVSFASIVEIIEASPERVEPPCPYFGRCGGCDFQQLSYEAQLNAKVSIIKDCLRRIAHLEPPEEIPITPSPIAWQYRSRAQWQYDSRTGRLGYFERSSHRVCDVAHCPVLVPALQDAFKDLRAQIDARASLPETTEFEAVAGENGASVWPSLSVETDAREVWRVIAGERYRFSARGFFQINHELLGPLVSAATGEARGDTAIDLYCGAGLFTLPLARRFSRIVAVEADATAIHYAQRNLADAQLSNTQTHCARVSDWLNENAQKLAPVDLALLDPPRAGAEQGAIAGIISLRPRRIAYISCDPATLARDLKELTASNYRLDTIAAFDMFPQTHHVETVAHLSSLCPK
ncbi:MAG: class I SAM-dependent RNA methyltransferase [Pyrinomonadaceae bacterium]